MLFVVGTTIRTRPIGLVAWECGLCRSVTRQRVLEREGSDHMMFVSVDRFCSHMRLCLECGNTTVADLRRHAHVVSDPSAESWPLPVLTAATYPEASSAEQHYAVLLERLSEADAEAKQALVHAAFAAVEWSVEVRSPRVTLAHRFFQIAGPLVIAGVGLWKVGTQWDNVTERIVGLVMAAVGVVIAALIIEVRVSRPLRISRQAVVPMLVRSLAPLRPTEDELARALAPFVARQSALPYVSSPASLARALS